MQNTQQLTEKKKEVELKVQVKEEEFQKLEEYNRQLEIAIEKHREYLCLSNKQIGSYVSAMLVQVWLARSGQVR
jgi:hypothetical protein